jgi:hypothetical protein
MSSLAQDLRDFELSEWFGAPVDISGHWRHFRAEPTAGIDADARRLPFVKAVAEEALERVGHAVAALGGADTRRYERAFRQCWPAGPLGLDKAARKGLRFVPTSVLAVHHANNILSHARPWTVLEIGAGLGDLAALLRRECGVKVYIVDLAETIRLAAKRLEPFGTVALPHMEPDRNINFFVPAQLERVPAVDLAVNIASMQEMRPTEIARYFAMIRERARLFYCANRVEKWLSDETGSADTPGSRRDYPVRFHDYPWGDCEDVFYRLSRFHRLVGAEPVFERLSHLAPAGRSS